MFLLLDNERSWLVVGARQAEPLVLEENVLDETFLVCDRGPHRSKATWVASFHGRATFPLAVRAPVACFCALHSLMAA